MHGFPVRTPICHIVPISRIYGGRLLISLGAGSHKRKVPRCHLYELHKTILTAIWPHVYSASAFCQEKELPSELVESTVDASDLLDGAKLQGVAPPVARLMLGDVIITSASTERKKRSQNLAPVLAIFSWNSQVFSRKSLPVLIFTGAVPPARQHQ